MPCLTSLRTVYRHGFRSLQRFGSEVGCVSISSRALGSTSRRHREASEFGSLLSLEIFGVAVPSKCLKSRGSGPSLTRPLETRILRAQQSHRQRSRLVMKRPA